MIINLVYFSMYVPSVEV